MKRTNSRHDVWVDLVLFSAAHRFIERVSNLADGTPDSFLLLARFVVWRAQGWPYAGRLLAVFGDQMINEFVEACRVWDIPWRVQLCRVTLLQSLDLPDLYSVGRGVQKGGWPLLDGLLEDMWLDSDVIMLWDLVELSTHLDLDIADFLFWGALHRLYEYVSNFLRIEWLMISIGKI